MTAEELVEYNRSKVWHGFYDKQQVHNKCIIEIGYVLLSIKYHERRAYEEWRGRG